MKRYCLTLDLKEDPALIEEYIKHHEDIWPEVRRSIEDSGITSMEIYLRENRLCMIMETDDHFSFERKQKLDRSNPKVQEWEALMWRFQKPLPGSRPGEKWQLMDRIFSL
jgi:L-rhamnose mutarotase